jgi:hypothetical protein
MHHITISTWLTNHGPEAVEERENEAQKEEKSFCDALPRGHDLDYFRKF